MSKKRRNPKSVKPTGVKSAVITFGGQNMTEGYVSDDIRALDVFVAQEADPGKLRNGLGDGWRVETPDKDHHQAVAWRTDVWNAVGPVESHKFHGSGSGDDDVPDGIATPARFVHVKMLRHQETGILCAFVFTWWINSWKPAGHRDQWTAARFRMAMKSRKVTLKVVKALKKRGYLVFVEGDFNSIIAALRFAAAGLKVVWRAGLDRLYRSKGKRIEILDKWRLRRVGVGNDMKHEGLACRARIKTGPIKKDKP